MTPGVETRVRRPAAPAGWEWGVGLRVARNAIWLIVGVGVASLVDFLIAVYLGRTFGPADYGRFMFAFALASVFSVFFDFGLSTVTTRALARDPAEERDVGALLGLEFALGGAGLLLLAGAAFVVSADPTVRLLAVAIGGYVMLREAANLLYAVFRARQRMAVEGVFRTLHAGLLAGGVLAAVHLQPSITVVGACYVVAALVVTVALALVLGRSLPGRTPWPTLAPEAWSRFVRIGVYLAVFKLLGDAINYADSVFLGMWGGPELVGWYAAAAKLTALFLAPITLVNGALFPTLVALHRESEEQFTPSWRVWLRVTLAGAGLVVVVVEACADAIVALFFSRAFAPAASVLRILIFKGALVWVHTTYYLAFLVVDQERAALAAVRNAAFVSVLGNVALIPWLGARGAAAASVAGHLTILVSYLLLAERSGTFSWRVAGIGPALGHTAAAAVLTLGGVWIIQGYGVPALASGAVGAGLYLGLMLAPLGWRGTRTRAMAGGSGDGMGGR